MTVGHIDVATEHEAVYSYPESAVLKPEQVMEWLQIGHKVFDLLDIPCIRLGKRTRRYLAKHVLEFLDAQREDPI